MRKNWHFQVIGTAIKLLFDPKLPKKAFFDVPFEVYGGGSMRQQEDGVTVWFTGLSYIVARVNNL
ncbi:MAG: hypothetical protein V7K40_26205 [Nostoc sp.]|uniref:hypothetical protein n=1 Tax=Nostoc sp. TaxID=1180 RepID=UPI002FF7926A